MNKGKFSGSQCNSAYDKTTLTSFSFSETISAGERNVAAEHAYISPSLFNAFTEADAIRENNSDRIFLDLMVDDANGDS